jgi:hypothetical protein
MVYLVKLEHGKYYVGYAEGSAEKRIRQHFSGSGAAWTKRHKPVKVLLIAEGDKRKERAMTLACMKRGGWENVRGSAWTACNLAKAPLDLSPRLAYEKNPPNRRVRLHRPQL